MGPCITARSKAQTPYAWGITCSQRQQKKRYRRQLGLIAAPGTAETLRKEHRDMAC